MNIIELIHQYGSILNNIDSSTSQSYYSTLTTLERYFTGSEREQLVKTDYVDYERYLVEEGYADDTIKLYLVVFRKLVAWAVQEDLVPAELSVKLTAHYESFGRSGIPYKRREIDPKAIKEVIDAYANPTAAQLTDLTYLRNRAIIYLFAGTGLRVSELISLNRRPFDEFFATWNGTTPMVQTIIGKGKKIGDVGIIPKYLKPTQTYLKTRGFDRYPPLFINLSNFKGGNRERRLTRQAIYKIVREASDSDSFVAPHALRHYLLQKLADKNVDLGQLADIARHANPATTKRSYLDRTKGSRMAKIIDEALGKDDQ